MSQLALITPIDPANTPEWGGGIPANPNRPDNSLPPLELPPAPPGGPALPDNTLPAYGARPSHPIFIPAEPGHDLPQPPGTIWPPLNPSDGIYGEGLLLVWVVGTDRYRWIVVPPPMPWPPPPPTAQPK